MPAPTDRFFIVTGGPGSGKTILIRALGEAGYCTAPEAGRAIIVAQRRIGGPADPASDPALFAELMLAWEIRSHEAAQAVPEIHVFDRGIPDLVGYSRLMGLPVPDHFRRAAAEWRYNPTVFVAPHWPQIYENDTERSQSPEEAVRTERHVIAAYAELGYRLVELPRASVDERVAFMRATALARAT
jgi:predicted ATPase